MTYLIINIAYTQFSNTSKMGPCMNCGKIRKNCQKGLYRRSCMIQLRELEYFMRVILFIAISSSKISSFKKYNSIYTQGVAKIGDFGCSVETKVMRKSQIGSPNYLSPEQLSNHFYNNKIDIWSLGIITYELLLGVSPY